MSDSADAVDAASPTGRLDAIGSGKVDTLRMDRESLAPILKRLKRAQGQLGGIIRMIEDGRDCRDVVTQLAAVSKAVDRAGFAVIASGLRQCLVEDPSGENLDAGDLEKLFLSLA